ncbi:MAG: response regulator transcription factor [Phycisphaerales bacterium]|nr:MAG: response regulator transcription factor [Phycisphaerales bacterium]
MTQKQRQSATFENKTMVFIVDDHPIVRDGLTTIINHEKNLVVCGEADEPQDALKAISELKPDVVVVDITLKNSNGIELTKILKARYSALPVIVLSIHDESIYAERALRAGASGYLMKEVASENIVIAIRTVLSGEIYVSNKLGKHLLRKMAAAGKADTIIAPTDSLSDRELEVLRLTGRGYKPSKIAQSMHLSVKTVETYRARIKEKLNLANADELLRYAIQWVGSTYEA